MPPGAQTPEHENFIICYSRFRNFAVDSGDGNIEKNQMPNMPQRKTTRIRRQCGVFFPDRPACAKGIYCAGRAAGDGEKINFAIKNNNMCYSYIVEFQAMKGLGPDFITKNVQVGYDDVEAEGPEYVVRQWAKQEAEGILKKAGFLHIIYVDIHPA